MASLRGPSALLRLQSDERLIALVRRGNHNAFEALVSRYQARLLAFCRHMLGSREDAEDVLQDVFAAAYNAILADERPINARPWLYRIARNRSLNHLRRQTAVGVDSMDVHYAEAGLTTSEKVSQREEFRLLLADIDRLPETQRTALLLREMEALSYQQIAEVMDTTVPSVKSLLVRARVSLAEASEGRRLTCEEVRLELGAVAEGFEKETPPIRRHVKDCERCREFRAQLRANNRALAAVLPVVPFLFLKSPLVLIKSLLFKKLLLAKVGSTAGAGGATMSTATAGGASTAGAAGAAGAAGTAGVFGLGGGTTGVLSAGAGALATKAAAGLAAAAIVTAGAVEVRPSAPKHRRPVAAAVAPAGPYAREEVQSPQALNDVSRQLTGGTPAAAGNHTDKQKPTAASPNTPAPAAQTAPAPTSPSATPLKPTTQEGSSTTVLPPQTQDPQAQQPQPTTTTTTPPADTTTTSNPAGSSPSSSSPSSGTTTTPSSSSSPPSGTTTTTTTPSPSTPPSGTTTTTTPSTTTPSPSTPPSGTTTTPSSNPTKHSAASPSSPGATTTTTTSPPVGAGPGP